MYSDDYIIENDLSMRQEIIGLDFVGYGSGRIITVTNVIVFNCGKVLTLGNFQLQLSHI